MEMKKEDTREYLGLFIITPEKQDTVDEAKNKINAIISENSGKVLKESITKKKMLASSVKKQTSGIYYEVTFSALPRDVSKMTRLFRINTDILRTLIDRV
ncbi:MAG: 30S ribosomal protein S6 [Candidatus Omnitrophota bacterium]